MFRAICVIGALFAVMAVSTAHAQPKVCKKVDVSFACRNGGSGSASFNCRKGETETKCCARLRKRAADPRRGWCTGRGNGLASFECSCADEKGRRTGRTPAAGRKSDSAKKPKAKSGIRIGEAFRSEELAADVIWLCRRGGGGKGAERCHPRETKARCCARIRKSVDSACKNRGGVTRFQCTGSKKPGGKGAGALKPPGLERGPSERTGNTGRVLRSNACKRVSFSYTCRGQRKTGGRECRRNESERACCSHAFSVETRNCGRPPENWRCSCDDNASRRRLERR